MRCAADSDKAGKSADTAGNDHGAQDDLLDTNARIARRVLRFTNDRDLIAMLGILQINVHRDGQRHDNDDIEQILLAENFGEPAPFGIRMNDTDRV